MNTNIKFVDFDSFCKTCKYVKINERKEPCNTCLEVPARKGTAKPVKWKENVK